MQTKRVPAKRWLRKRHVRERYGDVAARTIERAVEAGRLPPPEFPFSNRVPFWDEAVLEQHDRAAATAATLGPARRPGSERKAPPAVRKQRKQQTAA